MWRERVSDRPRVVAHAMPGFVRFDIRNHPEPANFGVHALFCQDKHACLGRTLHAARDFVEFSCVVFAAIPQKILIFRFVIVRSYLSRSAEVPKNSLQSVFRCRLTPTIFYNRRPQAGCAEQSTQHAPQALRLFGSCSQNLVISIGFVGCSSCETPASVCLG